METEERKQRELLKELEEAVMHRIELAVKEAERNGAKSKRGPERRRMELERRRRLAESE